MSSPSIDDLSWARGQCPHADIVKRHQHGQLQHEPWPRDQYSGPSFNAARSVPSVIVAVPVVRRNVARCNMRYVEGRSVVTVGHPGDVGEWVRQIKMA